MRDLIILRGCPGSGKSTALKESGLENYSISSDKIRLMLRAPELMIDGKMQISQMDNQYVFKVLNEILESRMKNGSPTIIDATHCGSQKWHSKQMNHYRNLAKQYKYRLFYWEPEIEKCSVYIERNKEREELYQVPDSVIQKMYQNWKSVPMHRDFTKIDSIKFRNELEGFDTDISERYKNIIVVGDIHGCYEPLKELTNKYDIHDESNLFVFVGDYFDRGIQNLEVLDFLFDIYKQKNIILLEGNHEGHWADWAHNVEREDSGMFRFKNITLNEWKAKYNNEDELKKKLRDLYRKLIPAYFFNFLGTKFLITHAGLACLPKAGMAAWQYISGHGGYSFNVSEEFQKNVNKDNSNVIQVFGHRSGITTSNSKSLEGQIEFGGYLKYLLINNAQLEVFKIKNDVYDKNSLENDQKLKSLHRGSLVETRNHAINTIANSRYVVRKKMPNNIMSLNFSRDVFYKAIWNDITIKARGLFVDQDSGEVLGRSYNKFFNFGEMGNKDLEFNSLIYPVKIARKENGFLGIIFWDKRFNEPVLASKSTTEGEHVKLLKDIWNNVSDKNKDIILTICKEYDVSAIFEVCHPEDVHIVDYNKEKKLFLLDFVKNSLDIEGHDIKFSQRLLNRCHDLLDKKDQYLKIVEYQYVNSEEEYKYIAEKYLTNDNIEGYVCTDRSGKMYKQKSDSYLLWKRRRRILESIYSNYNIPDEIQEEEKEFIKFLKRSETKFSSIIEAKKAFELDNNK